MNRPIHITLGRIASVETEEKTLNFAQTERVERSVPKAMIWRTYAEPEEIEKARAFVETEAFEKWEVFTFPTTEEDPFGATKRILQERIDNEE